MTASSFRALHQGRTAGNPLVLPGPWDATSAQVFADAGFPALATPSAGIAASLGYQDGSTPADEMFAAVARIVRAVDVPVSADIEGGYGLDPGELVGRLLETGAIGCNLEDSEGHSTLKDPEEHAEWLAGVRAEAGEDLFINARVDTFLFGTRDPADAVARARLYVNAGADCVYPLLAPLDVYPELRKGIEGPLNMAADEPNEESVAALAGLGVTRITFGPGMHRHVRGATSKLATRLRD
ncbi:isocitrate lyase/phosphoenolpyruvate mutase family protein [Streptomyces sp. NPDC051217]|uniref:isocitrate lyase/phosphoenolpyruvate mutase family protein n=1 Tax=Streptomyces sp. NPDC051217 TaxID=3365644 RepID=UPI00378B5B0B